MSEYDIIIVGAGPAGQSLAARLAQAPLNLTPGARRLVEASLRH